MRRYAVHDEGEGDEGDTMLEWSALQGEGAISPPDLLGQRKGPVRSGAQSLRCFGCIQPEAY